MVLLLNILHIVYAKEWGGGESSAYLMCKELARHNNTVYVAIDNRDFEYERKFQNIVRTVRISMKSNMLRGVYELRRFIKKNAIQVIHTHTGKIIPMVILAAWGLPVKIISHRHNVLANKSDIIHNFIYSRIDAFVCVSKLVYDLQYATMFGKYRSKLFCVYNGVDIDCVQSSRKKHDMFCIGYAGRIDPSKGIIDLILALENLKYNSCRLIIAGDDNVQYAATLKALAKEKGIDNKIDWIGFQNDMSEFYGMIDVLVMPSVIKEAFGMVICESMLQGIPVIATNSGAQAEIIENNVDGYIVNANSHAELADVLDKMMLNKENVHNMGQLARAKVLTNFTMSNWYVNMLSVYGHLGLV